MRGREGTGQHAQRMTRLRRPGCGRLQRVGSWGGGVLVWKSPPGSVEQLTEGFPGSPTFWEEMPIQRLSILPDISPLFLYQGLTSGNTPSPPSTLDLTSSSEQGTQCPFPKGFNVQERFIPNAHGNHLLHSEF